jgi:two-component system, OmpR family, heavy metal sensor histidine kinase CusS
MTRKLSLTARMSLLFALSAAAVLMLAGVLFVRAGKARFLDNDREEITGKLELVREILAGARTPQDLSDLHARLRDTSFGHPGMAVYVASGTAVLYATGDRQVVAHLAAAGDTGQAQPALWRLDDRSFRVAEARFPLGLPGRPPALVGIALDVSEDQAFLSEFEEYLWFGIAQVALVLGWLGWVIVRQGLAPLATLSSRISKVSAQALDQPLETAGVPAELEGLVASFNAMLRRLHDSFRRLSEFSDDLAHELRTPINNLMLQTQVTLEGAATLEECRAALAANEEECERLSRMISDMLFLAKAENRLLAPHREAIDLRAEVAVLIEFFGVVANDRKIGLVAEGGLQVDGDRLMLRRALSNLIANALRYTPSGGTVRVALETGVNGEGRMAVINPGPEIPDALRSRIFDRFFRVDASRQAQSGEQSGLGLAITRSIARMHGGDVEVTCAEGLTTFTIRLPSRGSD